MSRRASFTTAEVRIAMEALKASGRTVTGFEKTQDGFRLLTDGDGDPPSSPAPAEDAWAARVEKWRRSA